MSDLMFNGVVAFIVFMVSIFTVLKLKTQEKSFGYGLALSCLVYVIQSLVFFWVCVLRRMQVLNLNHIFDSESIFAIFFVPILVAIPWLPLGIISGFLSKLKGIKYSNKFITIISVILTIAFFLVFWFLPYN